MEHTKDIKVVIFDFDDTLYSGVDWAPWNDFCFESIPQVFNTLSESEIENIVETCKHTGSSDRIIIKELYKHGLSPDVWLNHRDTFLGSTFRLDYSNAVVVKNEVLKDFADKYVLYIVSNSTLREIYETAKLINIDLSYFKKIYVNRWIETDYTKKSMYQEIIDTEGIEPHQLFVIGNSITSDIEPAIEIGAHYKHTTVADFKLSDFDL